jgi:hypothetical protein
MERDAEHAQIEVVRRDYLTRTHAFTSNSKHSINFNRMLEELQIILSLQEMDLEVWEVKLVEEQACCLHSFDGWDPSAELEELRVHVTGMRMSTLPRLGSFRHWSWRPPTPYSTSGCYQSEIFPNSQRQLKRSWRRWVSFCSACERGMPSAPLPGTKCWLVSVPVPPSQTAYHFFFWNSYKNTCVCVSLSLYIY